jgi:hypothetical protein
MTIGGINLESPGMGFNLAILKFVTYEKETSKVKRVKLSKTSDRYIRTE